MSKLFFAFAFAVCVFANTIGAKAQNYPAPKEGDWVARDFRFHTGEVLPELRIHYTTIGEPSPLRVLAPALALQPVNLFGVLAR